VAHAGVEKSELIGTPAPAWQVGDWINSPPLTLSAVREA
jgi:hypothetical protein